MSTIEFTVNADGSFDLKLRGPKKIHKLGPEISQDLAEFTGSDTPLVVERPELTEPETPVRNLPQSQKQAQRH